MSETERTKFNLALPNPLMDQFEELTSSYGNAKKWVAQSVPEGTYTEAFQDLPPDARAKLDLILTDAMKELNLP